MPSTKHYIAVDLGATSGRVILASVTDGIISTETVHRFPTPLLRIGKAYYWNIYSIYDDIVKGLGEVAAKGVKPESIGIDTWGVDFVGVAKDGTFCGLPRSYRDPYTVGIPEKFFKKMSRGDLYDRTGIQVMNFNSVFQIFAQHKAKCSSIRNSRRLLFIPDALSFMLTGKMVCEYTILSTSALVNPRKRRLDRTIVRTAGICPRKFPSIVQPGHKTGRLTEELAERTGLGRVPVIAVAGHDTASAVAAVPAKDGHFAYLSSGTWSLMGIETKEPVINTTMAEANFTNEGGVNGTTRVLKNITGMWLLEQCLEKWRSEGREYSYKEIELMAAGCEKSASVINPDDPSFASPTDMPAAISAYCTAHGIPVPEDHAHMIRLIYDSLAAKYAEVFRKLREIAPFSLDVLHIIGGGSRNALMNQLTANACGVTVVAGPGEGTALGNIMIQAGLSRKEIAKSVVTTTYLPEE